MLATLVKFGKKPTREGTGQSFKKPQKKSLQNKTAETIRNLEQLAGILSLVVLKTSDYDMT